MARRQVETATGPVDGERLGFTLSHEHVLVSSAGVRENFPFLRDNVRTRERIVRELAEAKAGGVDTIIDLTTMDLGRDVGFFAEVSRASGMQVVVCTGLWLDVPRAFLGRDPDFIAGIFVHEIEHGIAGTGIKPAVIKVANDMEGVTPAGEVVLRGAARACKATGVPISTHQWAPDRIGARQVEIFQEEGLDMSRVCIGHSADTTDIEYLTGLLEKGVYLSMDRYPGREGRPSWEARNATVKALVDRGFADRLMLGHDYAPPAVLAGERLAEEGGPTTYLFLSRTAIPGLRQTGVSEAAIHTMTVEVPRRFLCGGD
jgi:phosphotriesterase-related protein